MAHEHLGQTVCGSQFVKMGVVNGNGGLVGYLFHDALIVFGKALAFLFVGNVDNSDDFVVGAQGHA